MIECFDELLGLVRDCVQDVVDVLWCGLEGFNVVVMVVVEEVQEIDVVFQVCICQNYELLSDFMLCMGFVVGGC